MNQQSFEAGGRDSGVPEGLVTLDQAATAMTASQQELIQMLAQAEVPIQRLHVQGRDLSAISAQDLEALLPRGEAPAQALAPVAPALPVGRTDGTPPAPAAREAGQAAVSSFDARLEATLHSLNGVAAGVPEAAQAEVRWAAIRAQFQGLRERLVAAERSVVERRARIERLRRVHDERARELEQARALEGAAGQELQRAVDALAALERQVAGNQDLLQRLELHLGETGALRGT